MFDLSNPKLRTLAKSEGFPGVGVFMNAVMLDAVYTNAICLNPNCDAVAEMEPDQDHGFCEECGTQTVKSALVIAGVI